MSALTIRKANIDDLDSLIALEHTCFDTDKMSRASYRKLLKKSSAEILIATYHDNLVGSATILFRKNSTIARLYSLAVLPTERQRGIATELQHHLEKIVIQRKCTTLILEVRKDNPAAIRFYQKHGFHSFAECSHFYEDGQDAIRMKKIFCSQTLHNKGN